MKIDLCIKNIDAIYHLRTNDWKRDFCAPRLKDGVVLILEGENKYKFPSEEFTAQKNDILILPGNVPYSGISCSGGKFEVIVIDFECCEGESLNNLGLPYLITATDKEYYELLFKDIMRVWENKYLDSNLQIKSLLYKLIYKLYREANPVTDEKIALILEYINTNLDNKSLSVTDLCDMFFISESTLTRGIKKLTGYTPNVYINLQRLEKAREYIMAGEKSIKEISKLCGFSSPYYFSNVFKKKYGCSPRNYKNILNRNNGGKNFN